MKKETRMGLIAGGIVAGLVLLALVVVLAIRSGGSSGGVFAGPDLRRVEQELINNSNGIILFNKEGKVLVLHGHEFYPIENASFMISIARRMFPKEVESMGPDTYLVPLPQGLGSRYSSDHARNLLTDWMRQGTIAERSK